jgi:hypothetical protein
MGKGDKKKFDIPDPQLQIDTVVKHISKYKIGEKGFSFHAIKELKPVFAFDYLSLNCTDLCFNSKSLEIKDYVGLFEGLKKISNITYEKMKVNPAFRFHQIDFDAKNVSLSRSKFKQILSPKEDLLSDGELPTLYQFDLQYVQKARVAGFLYKGVFYLVFYDRDHLIYPGN